MPSTDEMYAGMERIGRRIIADWKQNGQHNYGDAFLELGAQGQFSDIWRKIKKLKRSVWDGIELRGEQPEQIAAEIIPHCLMMIYCLQQEKQGVRSASNFKPERPPVNPSNPSS